MLARDYPAIAEAYARDIGRGRIPACQSIRLQCARYLAELKVARRKEFPYRFDPDKAARACRFVEALPHTKGQWAAVKKTIQLEPWQVWILCATFGWLEKATGLRRFRLLFVVVPRKNGKSALSAGIANYMFCADGEYGAEVYSGATNEKQAWEVFQPARIMVTRTPALKKRFGVTVAAKSMFRVADGSKFETITGSPGDGQSPSCSVHDEYHEHTDDGQVETMRTGMGARSQPLQVLITTAGVNLAGPCYARIQEERKRLAGIGVIDAAASRLATFGLPPGPDLEDRTFFAEYTLDDGDDWKAEASLRKANPNFGVSVGEQFLRDELRDAISRPRRAGIFKTKNDDLCKLNGRFPPLMPPKGGFFLGCEQGQRGTQDFPDFRRRSKAVRCGRYARIAHGTHVREHIAGPSDRPSGHRRIPRMDPAPSQASSRNRGASDVSARQQPDDLRSTLDARRPLRRPRGRRQRAASGLTARAMPAPVTVAEAARVAIVAARLAGQARTMQRIGELDPATIAAGLHLAARRYGAVELGRERAAELAREAADQAAADLNRPDRAA